MTRAAVVFVHSPLLDGQTWEPVAELLSVPSVIPDLRTDVDEASPARRHVEVIVEAARRTRAEVVHLVAHSGAGVLVAPVVDGLQGIPATAVFVDAMLPRPGASRFDLIAWESYDDTATRLRHHLDGGGLFPRWSDRTWTRLVADADLRERLRPTLRPLGASYWDELVDGSDAWERVPAIYVRCTDTYAPYEELAKGMGWLCDRCDGGHLAPATSPEAIATIVERWIARAHAGR